MGKRGGLNMGIYNKIFFRCSLIYDRAFYELKGLPLYNLLKPFEPTKNPFNSFLWSIKDTRIDKREI